MTLEFDHLFICCDTGAPDVDTILSCGFTEGSSNRHPGQGTTNRRLFFPNAMLEFLWIENTEEVQQPEIRPIRLWERSRHRETGYSPFGVSLRPRGQSISIPFTTVAYAPPYLPASLQIDIAASTHPAEPLIFVIPFGKRPDQLMGDRQQPLEHACGCREITQVHIDIVQQAPLSDAATTLDTEGIVHVHPASEPLATVAFDHGRQGRSLDCRPRLPLRLQW